jgi:UDP-N-acetylenolpyruvoylglucosamine reductase
VDPPIAKGTSDTEIMMNGLKISDNNGGLEEVNYEDLNKESSSSIIADSQSVITTTAQMDQPQETPIDRRRREHEEYKQKRDADPAFVPNRGAFFMHDHRHAGPAANGFRPFGRGRGRGRGIGGPFAPVK